MKRVQENKRSFCELKDTFWNELHENVNDKTTSARLFYITRRIYKQIMTYFDVKNQYVREITLPERSTFVLPVTLYYRWVL